jgi:hypothetical protein
MRSQILKQITKLTTLIILCTINATPLLSQGNKKMNAHSQFIYLINNYKAINIFILISILCIFIYFYSLVRKKFSIYEFKIRNIEKMLAIIEDEKQLLLHKLIEKENEIDKILQKLHNEEVKANITELKEIILLTEDDWEEFLSVFQKNYPGFVDQLNEEFENLSLADLRYILLTFLGYTHKEMAKILAISTDSLRVSWYRLRKKLQLNDEITREAFIQEINERLG